MGGVERVDEVAGLEGADRVDEADRVLARLERIEQLVRLEHGDRPGGRSGTRASKRMLLVELRALVGEAEAWVRVEGDARALRAVAKLREGAEGMR